MQEMIPFYTLSRKNDAKYPLKIQVQRLTHRNRIKSISVLYMCAVCVYSHTFASVDADGTSICGTSIRGCHQGDSTLGIEDTTEQC